MSSDVRERMINGLQKGNKYGFVKMNDEMELRLHEDHGERLPLRAEL